MVTFTIVLLGLAVFYAVLLGAGAIGFARVTRPRIPPSSPADADLPHVSVIIPARNEERVIAACLDSVLANDYPRDRLEVIVIDDASTDKTAAAVQSFVYGGTVRLIQVDDVVKREAAHKKHALARGVAEAAGEIILTTDADCRVPPTWIQAMIGAFDHDVGMVSGPVLYHYGGAAFARVQALEFLGLVSLGAGLIGIRRPHLCNSANLAYRREAYEAVGGYDGIENVSTGDDEMLLHKMAFESDWEIATCMDGSAAVETAPSATFAEFFAQRRRWASAHARYPHKHLTLVSVLCYLFFAGLVTAALAGLWELLAAVLVLKIAAEASVLWPAARRFGRQRLLPLLLPAQLVHIPYILMIGFAGTFGGYEWKGRSLAR